MSTQANDNPRPVDARLYTQTITSWQSFMSDMNVRIKETELRHRFPKKGFHPIQYFKDNASTVLKLLPVVATDAVLTWYSIAYALDNVWVALIMVVGLSVLQVLLAHGAGATYRHYQQKTSTGKIFLLILCLVGEAILISAIMAFRIMNDAVSGSANTPTGGLAGAGGTGTEENHGVLTILFAASMICTAIYTFMVSHKAANPAKDDYEHAIANELELDELEHHISAVCAFVTNLSQQYERFEATDATNYDAAQRKCLAVASAYPPYVRRRLSEHDRSPVHTGLLTSLKERDAYNKTLKDIFDSYRNPSKATAMPGIVQDGASNIDERRAA